MGRAHINQPSCRAPRGCELLAFLAERGANVNARLAGGSTALHLAAGKHCEAIDSPAMYAQLIKLGADVQAKDDRGRTPAEHWEENQEM